MRAKRVGQGLVAVSALLLAACGGSEKPAAEPSPTVLLEAPVVAQLTPQVETKTGKSVASIDCPELPLPFLQGTSFHCQVTFTDASTMALFVSQADRRGTVQWTESG